MKRSPRPRRTAELSGSLHQQLNMYALAAGAAGVGLLALAQPAEGKIIYTKTNKSIGGTFHLDLNHDGIADFNFKNVAHRTTFGGTSGFLFADAAWARNGIAGYKVNQWSVPSALFANVWVGPKRKFLTHSVTMAGDNASSVPVGPWCNVKDRYLGLRFVIGGKIHFGWARLNVQCHGPVSATLTGYAYETIPNKPIITGRTKGPDDASVEESIANPTMPIPEPTTLGLLAIGAPGLSIWRREEPVGTGQQCAGT